MRETGCGRTSLVLCFLPGSALPASLDAACAGPETTDVNAIIARKVGFTEK